MKTNSTNAANLLLKVGLMAVVALMMHIPLSMVNRQISERECSMETSIKDIESSWGEEQCLAGPKIHFVYEIQSPDNLGNITAEKKEKDLFPVELKYSVKMETQNLHRSIYDVTVYSSTVHTSGSFSIPESLKGLTDGTLLISLSDLRGIEGAASINFNGKKYDFIAANDGNAIQTTVDVPEDAFVTDAVLPFDMEFKLKGSEALQFKPVGNMTEIEMSSNCKTPSFVGPFLPAERKVDEQGFNAKWIVSQINRGAPESTEFGVRLLQPVTQYQQTTRSAKYGILVIFLVFLAGFIVELITKKDINILQYLVIGLSLVLFYSLLLSFSEIMSFVLSYLIAAAMTTLALTGYYRGILKSRVAYLLGTFVALAYGISYILLQMETFALLGGTLVLFLCLLIVMYLTKDTGPFFRSSASQDSPSQTDKEVNI